MPPKKPIKEAIHVAFVIPINGITNKSIKMEMDANLFSIVCRGASFLNLINWVRYETTAEKRMNL